MNSINLGNVCDIIRGKHLKLDNIIDGPYKVISGKPEPLDKTHNEYNIDNNEIVICNNGPNTGYLNRFNEQVFVTDFCNIIKPKNINKDFLWYYLKLNQSDILTNYYNVTEIITIFKNLNKDKLLNEFMIPDLPLDHQEEIVKFLDEQFEKYNINALKRDLPIFNLLKAKQYDMAATLLQNVYHHMATELLHTIYHHIPNGIIEKNI
jgi:restriction endonuclease S subunit